MVAPVTPCAFLLRIDAVARRTQGEEFCVGGIAALRREIGARNLSLAAELDHETNYGSIASVLYRETATGSHGNFFPASYRRIIGNPDRARRLQKTYTASARIVRGSERKRAELDCANSSDALLMNIFCAPSTMRSAKLCGLLGVERGLQPMRGGHEDRTEMDMRCGDLLVEAKLSETGFQTARPGLISRYEEFEGTFDVERLPRVQGQFRGYQLLRGILAAQHGECRFAVFADARRPDLREQWFAVVSAVHAVDLRSRLLFVTWQEIARCVSRPLQNFLAAKYGITNADPRMG